MSTTPQWAVMPATDWDNIIAAVKEQTEDNTPLLSGEVAGKILSITAQPIKVHNCDYLFQNNRRLEQLDGFNLSEVTSANYMFDGANRLQHFPESMKFDEVNSAAYAFSKCIALVETPPLDLSNVTSTSNMFAGCTTLVEVGEIDMSGVEDASGMFSGCSNLPKITLKNTQNITNFDSMFVGCPFRDAIVDIDCSGGTSFASMFSGRPSYTNVTIRLNSTRNGTNFQSMFVSSIGIKEISGLDLTNATSLFRTMPASPSILNVIFGAQIKNYNEFVVNGVVDGSVGGEIGGSIGFTNAGLKLDMAKQILTCLVDYSGTESEGLYTVSLNSAVWALLDAEGDASPNGNTWREYVENKGWLY